MTQNTTSDAELVIQFRGGEAKAFRELVERYQKRLYRFALRMVRNHEDALDVTQEAFARVYRSLDRYDTEKRFSTWAYQIVQNLCIDCLRKRKKTLVPLEVSSPVSHSDPSRNLQSEETAAQVHKILARIPEKYRRVLELRDLEGMSCKAIAEIVECTHSTARWRLHQARKMFLEHWKRAEESTRQAQLRPVPAGRASRSSS